MIRNFFITALRNFRKNLSYTFINLIGLSLGFACCLVVFTILDFEYSFDEWHTNKDNIYRLTTIYHGDHEADYNGLVPYPYGQAVRENISQVKDVIEFHGRNDELLSFTDTENQLQVFREPNVLFTNSAFLTNMDFEVILGNPDDLDQPDKIFLTESLAKKYFQDQDPIGKTIQINQERPLEVAGIVEDSPKNTNLPFDCLISIETMRILQKQVWERWRMTWEYSTYLIVDPDVNTDKLSIQIDEMIDRRAYPDDQEEWSKTFIHLQPLDKIHSDERFGNGNHYAAPKLLLHSFFSIGLLILATSCLNFINLSTAQAINRSKEVGIRKTLGSSRKELITQFLSETFLLVAIANLIGVSIGQILLDGFNQTITVINYSLSFGGNIVLFSIALSLIITLAAGIYPALILAGYEPAIALKNKITLAKGAGSFNLRRTLIIAQFTFTGVLIISNLIIFQQIRYMKNKDLGFSTKDVFLVATPQNSEKAPNEFMNMLKRKSYVSGATLAYQPPISSNNWNNVYHLPGAEEEDDKRANIKFVDEYYIDFYGIELLAGENIPSERRNDSTYQILANEQLLETMGWTDPNEAIGKKLQANNDIWEISGIFRDFNYFTPHSAIGPVVLLPQPDMTKQIALKIPAEYQQLAVQEIGEDFKTYYPNDLYEFSFLDAQIEDEYVIENLMIRGVSFVSLLAILLSATGLYGLVSFMANRNAKMIGIRKVFGATSQSILGMFTKEYVRLLIISFLIASPLAYFLMNLWIESFAYRISIGYSFFLVGFLITFLIVIVTVGYRSLLAAKANPVDSLRYE